MKRQFGNMTTNDFLAQMISFFPKIKPEVENHKEEYGEILFTCVVEDIVMPRVLKLFEADDREKLKEMFAYFEAVSEKADRDLLNCFSVTVLETLGNDEQILRKAKEYMGPLTTKNQREADLALGRKVYI